MKDKLTLDSLEQFGWRFGLETSQSLLAELQHPENHLRVVHVAGSNGKGSTCAFMASFLKQSGFKTGLYTSPHLCDIRERFRINGRWISIKDFQRHSRRVLSACKKVKRKLGHYPTHFEALTAIAFSWFQEQKVDWVVLEVGLGGRLDATNVISHPALALIAPVSLEHQNILGKKIEKIAWEKAGILKMGCWAATVQTDPKALRTIERVAREKNCLLWVGGKDFRFGIRPGGFYWEGPGLKENIRLAQGGDYQILNASLAIAGIQALLAQGYPMNSQDIQRSISQTRWPGRLETLSRKPLILLDGAHNSAAAKVLASELLKGSPKKRWIVLNGFLKDKDYSAICRLLKPATLFSIVTDPPSDRKAESKKVFEAWERLGVRTFLVPQWEKALDLGVRKLKNVGPKVGLLITGSFYLGGACRGNLLGIKGLEKI